MYAGSVVIVNAQNYLKQGQSGWFNANSIHTTYSEALDSELKFVLAPGAEQASFRALFGFPSSYDAAATAAYLATTIKSDAFTADIAATMEGKTLAEIKADPTMKAAWEALWV